jgi:toxin HigB-1
LKAWKESIEQDGLLQTKNNRGYSDEAIKGKRKGQRSIRLNKAYRAIYTIKDLIVVIEEVNKHDY